MPSPPIVINPSPADGDTDVDPRGTFTFGVRDADTRVLRSSIRSVLLFHRIHYIGDNLPKFDQALRRGEGRSSVSAFSDATVVGIPGSPATQTLVPAGLDLTKNSSLKQESFLFASDRLVPGKCCGVEAKISVSSWTRGTTDYYSNSDFAGIVVALLNWRYRTGLFVMLMDDGAGTYYVNLVGPASNSGGSRFAIQNNLAIDWTTGSWRFRLVWDDSSNTESAFFIADDGSTEVSYILDTSAVQLLKTQQFLPGLAIAGHPTSLAEDRVYGAVGVDGLLGDGLTIEQLSVAGYGERITSGGAVLPGVSNVSISGNAAVPLLAGERDWQFVGSSGSVSEVAGNVALVVPAAGGAAYLEREEPDFARESWMVLGTLLVPSTSVALSVRQGLGIAVSDGSVRFELSLLDDNLVKRLGLFTGGAGLDLSDYVYGVEADWTNPCSIVMTGDSTTDRIYVEFNGDSYIDTTYAGSEASVSSDTMIDVGLLYSSTSRRELQIGSLWVFPTALFAEPLLTTLPDSQGWTLEQTGSPSSTIAIVDDEYVISCAEYPGEYLYYTAVPPVNEVESYQGGALFFRFLLSSWSNIYGAPSPTNSEIGPIASIAIGDTYSADLCLVRSGSGQSFVYLRTQAGIISEVLSQSPAGKEISAPINLSVAHSYFFDVRPGKYVRVYLDFDSEPAIQIPWDQFLLTFSSLPAGAVAGFGSINPDSPITGTFSFCRSGRGRGYDVRASLQISEEAVITWAYDSHATLLVDLEDS
jgi:hypothetical protein